MTARELSLQYGATAVLIIAVQVGLALSLGDYEPGTLAQALGVYAGTLGLFYGGICFGYFAVRYQPEGEGKRVTAPWRHIIGLTLTVGLGSWVALAKSSLGPVSQTILAENSSLVPSFLLFALGYLLLRYCEQNWLRGAAGGLSLLIALLALGVWSARLISYDPTVVNSLVVGFGLFAFTITGFVVSTGLKRLAFAELVIIAVSFNAILALVAGSVGVSVLKTFNIPKEQVLVLLAVVPFIVSLCFLSVGASIGFLLTGAGGFDSGFGYELLVGRRFLRSQIRLKDVVLFLATLGVGYLFWKLVSRLFRSQKSKSASPQNAVGSIMIISIAGVALGVMALVVVLSVMSGFEEDLKAKILGAHSHIVVQKKGDDFVEYKDIESKLSDVKGVRTTAAFVMGEGMVSSDGGLSGVLIKGLDPSSNANQDLRANIEQGSLDHLLTPEKIPMAKQFWGAFPRSSTSAVSLPGQPTTSLNSTAKRTRKLPGVVIGRELARTLRVGVGSIVSLVSPTSEEIGPTGPQPKLRRFRVAGVFFSGMYEYDSKFAYVSMKRAQRFLGMRKKASGVELRVRDVSDTGMIVEEIKRRVGGFPYTVKDWREMNKELFSALLLEKLAMFIVLIFIVLVASFNIVSTLVMIVLERGREIAILKSMGASKSSIMKIFVVQGLIVGVGGAVLGLVAGVSICWLIENFGLPLDKEIFYIDRLPVVMNWIEISIIAVSAIIVTYLATIYPAMAAATLRPVEGLRGE